MVPGERELECAYMWGLGPLPLLLQQTLFRIQISASPTSTLRTFTDAVTAALLRSQRACELQASGCYAGRSSGRPGGRVCCWPGGDAAGPAVCRQVERADRCTCFFPVLSGPDRAALPVVATVFDKLNQEYKRYLDAEQSYAAVSDHRRCAGGPSPPPVVVAAAGNGSNSGPCIPSPLVPLLVWVYLLDFTFR